MVLTNASSIYTCKRRTRSKHEREVITLIDLYMIYAVLFDPRDLGSSKYWTENDEGIYGGTWHFTLRVIMAWM